MKHILFWFLSIVLIFISSIRWNVGTDWYAYTDYFSKIEGYVDNPETNTMERGFTYLNYVVYQITGSYTVLLAIMAILTIGIKASFIYRHKQIMMLGLFLYFCYYMADIFAVRQYLAISITLLSIRYIIQRRFTPFLLVIIVAALVHITAVFFVFAYWIYPIRYSPKWMYSILLVALLLGFMDIGGILTKIAMNMVGVDSRVGDKLLFYGEEGEEITVGNPYIAFAIGVAKRALFLPIFIAFQPHIDAVNRPRYTGYLNLLIFGNIIYLMFMLSLPVMARLSTGFLLFEIFILGYLVVSIADKRLRMLAYVLVVLFGAFRLYNLISVYWELYVPFETIFAPTDIIRE
ncbi:EpsG family protein [Olivibacter sp. SDN3]|uniref:EpsG family protein n=1 Tax=Olivibacter sp. SDN3 TaxID=2764720 RepID=UPI0016517FAD|nr:EpsG family protein [Olivibacter sp. SDN3]QNL51584.1 EpsG family protein [Olivibacter sp. SDN3]